MMKRLYPFALLAAGVLLAACGSATGDDAVFGDAAPRTFSSSDAPDIQSMHVCQAERSIEELRIEFAQPMAETGRESDLVKLEYADGEIVACKVATAFKPAERVLTFECVPIDRSGELVVDVSAGLQRASGTMLKGKRYQFERSTIAAVGQRCMFFRPVASQ